MKKSPSLGNDNHSRAPVIDRKPLLNTPLTPLSTATETQIALLWAEALELDHVGIHDSLFDLGGHSISAAQILARVIQTFNVELPMRAVFEAATVAEMAALIDGSTKPTTDTERLDLLLTNIENISESEAATRLAARATNNRFNG